MTSKPTPVGDPLEIRLRELASKAALAPTQETKDTTTEEQKNDPTLWNNQYPELFETDYLRTLPRQDLMFGTGIQALDLRQHVARHDTKEGGQSVLAQDIQFANVESMHEKSLLLLLKKSRKSLTSITLNKSPIVGTETLSYLMSSFRSLTSFTLKESNINDIHLQTVYQRPRYLKDGQNLAVAIEHLDISGSGGITDEGISSMIKADACRWTQSLAMSDCPNISDMALLSFKLPRMFRQLTALDISNNNIGSLGVRQVSLACTALISLNLKNTLIVDSTLGDIGNGLKHLEVLNLENCVLITDEGLISLFNYEPPEEDPLAKMEEKDLGHHGWKSMARYIEQKQIIENNMTRKQKNRLLKKNNERNGCNRLKSLSLRGCYNVQSKGLQALAYCGGTTIEKLNLKGLPGINAWTFQALSVALVHLKWLDVSGQLNKTSSIAIKTAKALESHDVEGQKGKKSLARGDFYGHPLARMKGGSSAHDGSGGSDNISNTGNRRNTSKNETKSTPTPKAAVSGINLVSQQLETVIMTDGNIHSSLIINMIRNQTYGNLSSVQLRGCKNVTDLVLLALGQTCQQLQTLLVGACELISDKGIVSLCTGIWPVENANQTKKAYVPKTNAMLAHEAKKRKIEETKRKQQEKNGGCKQLKKIGLCGLWKLTDLSILAMATHCKQLTSIDVREITNFTNTSIEQIQENLLFLISVQMCNLSSFDMDCLGRCARALPLIGNIPHVRGPHVVLRYTSKSWLFIQQKRALHKRSAKEIQRGTRKYFASKRSLSFKIARAEKIVLKRKNCAIRIQSYVRGIAGRVLAKERRKELRRIRRARRKAAATRMQACVRRWIATMYVKRVRKAMQFFLAKYFKKFRKTVKKLISIRRIKACSRIQNTYRSYIARTAYRRMVAYRNAQARHIQRIVRGVHGRMLAYEYKLFKIRHAILLQRLVRGWYGRKRAVIVIQEIKDYRAWWDGFVISIQRRVKLKIRRAKWRFIIDLANQKKLFLAFKCQKYIRGMLGRIKAKVWISKWRYDCPTPLLFSTPECAIFNYEFSNQMYQLQQRVRVVVFCLWSTLNACFVVVLLYIKSHDPMMFMC